MVETAIRKIKEQQEKVAQQLAAEKGLEDAGSFTVTRIKLDGLEWTDGRLCIVIPKSERELKDEGNVLRHCVGSYGKTHCGGKPVFFVRHYRRPERSYYTLNIDMTGEMPVRIQLHGYGNERHGEYKQHTHAIPREVLEFCDRWEREVLAQFSLLFEQGQDVAGRMQDILRKLDGSGREEMADKLRGALKALAEKIGNAAM